MRALCLARSRIRARVGPNSDVPEWERLVENAARIAPRAQIIEPRPHDIEGGVWVLTDDHAPLEMLTDRFLSEAEDELLSR